MKLLTLNVGSPVFQHTVEALFTGNDREVLFIDWIPTSQTGRDVVMHQVNIVESTPNDVRMVIFDRYSSLTEEEIDFFQVRNAILLEPVAMPRDGFKFMPYWVDVVDLPLSTWDKDRLYDFGYTGKTLPHSAEATLLRCIKHVPSLKINVALEEPIAREKYTSLSEIMTLSNGHGHGHVSKFNSTLLTFDPVKCYKGYLPDIRNHLKYGVVPMVHNENRWFHSLFKDFIIHEWHDVAWYSKMRKLNYGFMDQLYKNMRTYMPEMITENFVKEIVGMVK